jgi:signal transduction histidine kinase
MVVATQHPAEFVDARVLLVRGLLSLAAMALLIVAGQAVVEVLLSRQASEAALINRAGRQRMLCERITKATLAARLAPSEAEAAAAEAEAREALLQWCESRQWLQDAVGVTGAGADNSPAAAAALERLEPEAGALARAVGVGAATPMPLAELLGHERAYLAQMDALVALYEREARTRVTRLVLVDGVLCGLLVLALAALAWVVLWPAFRRLRLAVQERARLQEQELRTRELTVASEVARSIGEDLHDGVGQTLTALSLSARALAQSLDAHPARTRADAIASSASAAITQVRAAANRLSPPDVAAIGLPAALERLAEDMRLTTGVACHADCRVGPEHGGEDLYRITQEAIANAVRHGGARHIDIRLTGRGPHGLLVITDDGLGAEAAAPAQEGLGLRSMRHRAARLGGSLLVGPREGGGWRVSCSFPLRARRTA